MSGPNKERRHVSFLLTTLTLVLFPLFLFIFCCLWLIRCILAWWRLAEHESLVGGMDAICGLDGHGSTEPLLSNISFYMEVDGRVELDEFQKMVESRWPGIVEEGKNRRRLTQYLTSLAGFLCFKNETDFQLRDHIRLLDFPELNDGATRQRNFKPESSCGRGRGLQKFLGTQMDKQMQENWNSCHWTSEELSQLATDLTRLPYQQNKSPWEILLLYNPENSNLKNSESESESELENQDLKKGLKNGAKWSTVLFFRYSHSLGDGAALVCIQSQLLDQSQSEAYGKTLANRIPLKQQEEQQPLASLLSFPQTVVDVAGDIPQFISHLVNAWPWGRNPLFQELTTSTLSVPFHIPLEVIRALRRKHKGASTTPIIMAAFTRTLYQYRKLAHKSEKTVKIPSSFHLQPFVAFPREINELGNSFNANGFKVSIDPDLHSRQLVEMINREYTLLYGAPALSPSTKLYSRAVQLLGVMPKYVLRKRPSTAFSDASFTNLPTFETPVTILGHQVTSHFVVAMVRMTAEFWIVSMGDHEKLNFTVQMDRKVIKNRDEARTLVKMFKQQLYEM